jgi:hypothetical protein
LRPKTEVEMNRAALLKTARTLTRLKHSLAADQELNDLLPMTLREFDDAVARGELRSVQAKLDAILEA